MRLNTERLDAIIKVKFGGYLALEAASKGEDGKPKITARTLYNLMAGQGWRNETINTLCEILEVDPSQIIELGNGSNSHTHARPRPARVAKELQTTSS